MFRPSVIAGAQRIHQGEFRSSVPRQLGQERPIIRFEVKDSSGAQFVPNASVSLVFEDGTHILSKLTDAGGNVSFSNTELENALQNAGLQGVEGVVWYTVEASGYQIAEGIVYDPKVPVEQQTRRIYEVALNPAAPAQANPYVTAGLTTVMVLAIGLAL